MKRPRLRTILLLPVAAFLLFYLVATIGLWLDDEKAPAMVGPAASYETVAIFGASGTAGDGILKAALADPAIDTIHVFTRRETSRILEGVASGKVIMTLHMDYLDFTAIADKIAELDTVYWAIGTSTFNVDEETYRKIHTDFPMRFVEQWLAVSNKPGIAFHYISSSDISADSSMMWAREKVYAERSLSGFAEGTKMKAVFYRPDYIRPTDEEANLGQRLIYWSLAPVASAVVATQIGQAMLEASARGDEFGNGDYLVTRKILRYSDAYEDRIGI